MGTPKPDSADSTKLFLSIAAVSARRTPVSRNIGERFWLKNTAKTRGSGSSTILYSSLSL